MTQSSAKAVPAVSSREACPTCGATIATPYCAACGEQRASDRHYTLSHLLEEVAEGFTHADQKALRTVRSLLTKPGELTRQFMLGGRKHFVGPVQLFLLLNLVFFLTQIGSGGGPFTPILKIQKIEPYRNVAIKMIDRARAKTGLSEEELEKEFDRDVQLHAKSMVIIMVPMLAVCVGLLEFWKRKFVVQHFVFALHWMAFMLAYLSVVLFALRLSAYWHLLPRGNYEIAFSSLSYTVLFVYLWRGLRRAYGNSNLVAILLAVPLAAAFQVCLYAYRFVMLYITLRGMRA